MIGDVRTVIFTPHSYGKKSYNFLGGDYRESALTIGCESAERSDPLGEFTWGRAPRASERGAGVASWCILAGPAGVTGAVC